MNRHPQEALGRYADGELDAEEVRRVEAHLKGCTECAREVAIIRSLGGVMRSTHPSGPGHSVWEGVVGRLAPRVGWTLIGVGVLIWAALAVGAWFEEAFTLEWLAGSAVGVGVLVLFAGIAWEQLREWRGSPYKDVDR